MSPNYYSYASKQSGIEDPADSEFTQHNPDNCPIRGCSGTCQHNSIIWKGREYSARRTWITTEDAALIDLNEVR